VCGTGTTVLLKRGRSTKDTKNTKEPEQGGFVASLGWDGSLVHCFRRGREALLATPATGPPKSNIYLSLPVRPSLTALKAAEPRGERRSRRKVIYTSPSRSGRA